MRQERRDAFQALADPTRREIIGLLAQQTLTLNRISAHFTISRPAVSKQIKFLVECGVVEIEQKGRERYCSIQLKPLNEVVEWIDTYREIWESRLDRLDQFLHTLQNNPQDNDET